MYTGEQNFLGFYKVCKAFLVSLTNDFSCNLLFLLHFSVLNLISVLGTIRVFEIVFATKLLTPKQCTIGFQPSPKMLFGIFYVIIFLQTTFICIMEWHLPNVGASDSLQWTKLVLQMALHKVDLKIQTIIFARTAPKYFKLCFNVL